MTWLINLFKSIGDFFTDKSADLQDFSQSARLKYLELKSHYQKVMGVIAVISFITGAVFGKRFL